MRVDLLTLAYTHLTGTRRPICRPKRLDRHVCNSLVTFPGQEQETGLSESATSD